MLSAIRPPIAAFLMVTAMTASACAPAPTGGQPHPEGASVPLSAKPSDVTAEPETNLSRSGGYAPLQTITSEDELRRIVASSAKPVLVFISAPWCGPCRSMTTTLEELAENEAQRVQIVSINIDRMPSIARDYQVATLPTMILNKEGRVIDFLRGAFPKRVVLEFLGRNLP